jgi:two-component system LytT family response regulator
MKAVLIDPDRDSLEALAKMLHTHCPEVQIAATCDSAVDGLLKIKDIKPELIFMEVDMPQLNGFDLLSHAQPRNSDVVFTTASDKHAVKAFKISALEYLLKPIDVEELKAAVQKSSHKRNHVNSGQLDKLLNYVIPQKPRARRVALTASDHLVFVETEKIVYCESDSNYTTFFLSDGQKVIVSKTLKDVEEILEGADFFRIHASFLINMKHVSKFTRGDGGYVVMSNNEHINVSRKKKDEFFEMFSRI